MMNPSQIAMPISEVIKTDAAANDAFQKIMGTDLSGICAPFVGMGTPWTEGEEKELIEILSEYPPETR